MQYITLTEFYGHMHKPVLAQLTDSTSGEPNAEVLEEVNRDAASEVDDFLRGIYTLPLAEPVPRTVKTITADIMKYRLYQRRDPKNLPEEIFKLYKMALDRLRDIQARRLVLDVPKPEATEPGAGASQTVKSWTPTQKFPNHFTQFDQ